MSSAILKAVKDWCTGKFQEKGNYLTEVPEEYVTETELEAKKYVTQEDILPTETGMTEIEVIELVNELFLDSMSGVRISQNAEGNWGYIIPDTDEVVLFESGNTIKLYEWYVTLNDGFTPATNNKEVFAYTTTSSSKQLRQLNLVINISSPVRVSMGLTADSKTEVNIYLNSESIYTKGVTATQRTETLELNLVEGVNSLEIVHITSSSGAYGKVAVPSVAC